MLLLLRPCTKWRRQKKIKSTSIHQYSWNSEVETKWISLIGWHHKTSIVLCRPSSMYQYQLWSLFNSNKIRKKNNLIIFYFFFESNLIISYNLWVMSRSFTSKVDIPSTLNIDLILWHTQLIVCAENVKSWFKSRVFLLLFKLISCPIHWNVCFLAYLYFIFEF